MGFGASMLRALLLLLDVGVLATGKSAGAEIDIKYAIIGTAVGVAISAGFLALKICMIKKHLFDNDSSDLRNSNLGFNDSVTLKKRVPRYPTQVCSLIHLLIQPTAAIPASAQLICSCSSSWLSGGW
ncbi:transmembrane protein 273 isoform X1 [Prionailurus viverrinus]|uniref:transmembrane protein 273 isoform X1 n=2 Tax=Prionailurus viverrinus TaxID=61388 RepID=UPI001FF16C61|nr:transmembrane protein 273 isoform X1 [Prionailurus viverrinus]